MGKRVIKFRAWDGSEMWYQGQGNTSLVFFGQPDRIPFGVYNHAEGSRLMTGDENAIFNNTSILMQFTGLTDKNGVEIYEGDIVQVFRANITNEIETYFCHQVDYNDGAFGYWLEKGKSFQNFISFECNSNFKWSKQRSQFIEIIGNIYQHPHLLTKSTDNQ